MRLFVIFTEMNAENFKRTVLPLRNKLLHVAQSLLMDASDAEDAVQETYLRLWQVRGQLARHPNVSGFAMQTLKNLCIDRIRTRKEHVSLEYANYPDELKRPDLLIEQKDSTDNIRRIIATLPELQRRIMLMRDVEGYELKEIAEIIGSEVSAVTMNLSRARKKVRDLFLRIT